MLNDLFYIVWDFDPVMFSIGSVDIRYYGLTWALTILLGERFFSYFARREGFGPQIVETGFIWMTLGAILGARIGHCLFYEFSYYIAKPWAIITEIRNGGMASHGAAIGMLIGMWITARKCRMPYVWWLDRIMIPVSIGGALVRPGKPLQFGDRGGGDRPAVGIQVRASLSRHARGADPRAASRAVV